MTVLELINYCIKNEIPFDKPIRILYNCYDDWYSIDEELSELDIDEYLSLEQLTIRF